MQNQKQSNLPKPLLKGIDHIGVSVVNFCHDNTGRFVMLKRGAKARDENGRWDLPAGGLEFGETVEGTIKKEIKEEICADVVSFEFLGFRDVHREHNGRPTHWIALDFKVLVNPEQVKIGEPHKFDEIKWFSLSDLPIDSQMHSQLPLFLEKYKHKLWL